VNEQRHH
jgi:hypothetical protein